MIRISEAVPPFKSCGWLLEPDRMYLNPEHIVFVEPVGEKSKVAQLNAQAHQLFRLMLFT
jgi:hypothetical protein